METWCCPFLDRFPQNTELYRVMTTTPGGSGRHMRLDTIINRDALCALRELPAESVHCCVTSPPYYALRDYGMDAQIGREDTPEQYIARLVEVFHELKRVLRPDGTFWLNIADTYCGTGSKGAYTDPKNPKGRNGQSLSLARRAAGCKQKDLIGIPWLLAFALRSDGWYLRSAIIWQKDNPMPESVKDRPSRCYENVFLLTKSKSYSMMPPPLRNPLPQQRRRDTGAGAARDTNTTARYPDRARCRASTGRGQAATTMKPSCRPRGISGRVAYQHRTLQGRAFRRVPAEAGGNLHFGGLSQGRHCA